MISLATFPLLEWKGRQAVLLAEAEQEALRLYAYDLLWAAVKDKYKDLPKPSSLAHKDRSAEKKGPKTAKEIKKYIADKILNLISNGAEMHSVNGDDVTDGSYDLNGAYNT